MPVIVVRPIFAALYYLALTNTAYCPTEYAHPRWFCMMYSSWRTMASELHPRINTSLPEINRACRLPNR